MEPASLDLFAEQGIVKDMTGSRQSVVLPLPYNDRSAIHFQIKKIPYNYIDLSSAVLYGSVKISRTDLTTGKEENHDLDNISLCNFYPAALFKGMEVSIGGQSITKMSTNHFHYKTYLQTLLNYGDDAKDTYWEAAGWFMDNPGEFEDFFGEGCSERRTWTKFSRTTNFALPLQTGIFAIDKLFPDYLDIDIRFTRNEDAVPLFYKELKEENLKKPVDENNAEADDTKKYNEMKAKVAKQGSYKFNINISNVSLKFRRIILKPTTVAKHQTLLNENKLLRYPWTRTDIKLGGMINKGTRELKTNDLYSDRLPSSLVIGLIKSEGFLGSNTTNPFNFENFNLNNIYVEVNQKKVPADGYRPDFKEGNFREEYLAFFENIGLRGGASNGISMDYFKKGCTLYAFDFTPDKCLNYHSHEDDYGILNLSIELAEPAEDNITVLCFANYEEVLSIDKDGQCFFDIAVT